MTDEKTKGMTLIHKGIPEYEILDGEKNEIALTLLRCFEVAGGGLETYREEPLAQCPGQHEFSYALYFHDGQINGGNLIKEAKDFRIPLKVSETTAHEGSINKNKLSFISIDTDKISFTGIKKAETGAAIVLRCFNPGSEPVKATLTSAVNIDKAHKITMEEKVIEKLEVKCNNKVSIEVNSGEIYSVKLLLNK